MIKGNVHLEVRESKPISFDGELHLAEIVDDLFRTGDEEILENVYTSSCFFIPNLKDELRFFPFMNLETRLEFRTMGLKLIEAKGLGVDNLLNDIAFITLTNDDGIDMRLSLKPEDVSSILQNVIGIKRPHGKAIFHIAHLDEGEWHIHSILAKTKGKV